LTGYTRRPKNTPKGSKFLKLRKSKSLYVQNGPM